MNLPKPIHVLGVGSPFGNDTFGWDFVDELADRNTHLILHKLLNPMAELLRAIEGAGSVVVVDAVRGADQGEIFFDHYSKWQPRNEWSCSHGVGVMEALQVARNLGELPEQCYVFAVAENHAPISSICTHFLGEL